MDSQHRHELQTSEFEKLLQWLNHFLEKHGNRISIGICLAAALAVAGILWQRSTRAKEQIAWSQLAVAGSPEDLGDVWSQNPDATAAPWARLLEAEQRLAAGVKSMFLDLEAGRKDAEKARTSFERLSEQSSAPREVRERALFGLARAEESLSDGSTQSAVAVYTRFLERYPESFFKEDAKQRIAALSAGGSSEFYQWFAKFDRPKAKDQTPRDTGMSGGADDDLLQEAIRKINEKQAANPAEDSTDPGDPDSKETGDAKEKLTPPEEEGSEAVMPPEPTEADESAPKEPAGDDSAEETSDAETPKEQTSTEADGAESSETSPPETKPAE